MDFSADTAIALGALVVAAGSAIASGLIGRRQTRLQEKQARLAEQLAQYEIDAHRERKELEGQTRFDLSLVEEGKKLKLTNIGGVPALSLNADVLSISNGRSSVVPRRDLPLSILEPGDSCSFLVS